MDRRDHPRFALYHPADCVLPNSAVASTVDLSMGGVGIDTSGGLTMGEILDISIPISPEVMKCKARVVHVVRLMGERLRAGLRFEEMSHQNRLLLADYISSILSQEGVMKVPIGFMIGAGISALLWAIIIYTVFLLI
jgi:hypothetical protein